jgi:hypothetical protein
MVHFDYREAHSELVPWRVDPADVCRANPAGELLEFPIYCEDRRIHHFLSANRVHRAIQSRLHPLPTEGLVLADDGGSNNSSVGRFRRALALVTGRHAWKLDFNQCSRRQLIGGLENAAKRYDGLDRSLPLVLIGHSKLFTKLNQRTLEPFLQYVAGRPDRFRFATFRDSLARVSPIAP